MKNIFVCTTKYHLFNIINIIHDNYITDDNILIILDCIEGISLEMQIIAKKFKYFSSIVIMHAGSINASKKSYLQTLYRIVFPSSLGNCPGEINRLFITATEIYSRILGYNLLEKNPFMELYYYEDGLESYSDILSKSTHNKSNILLKWRFGYYLIDRCKGLFVYKPQYVLENPYKKNIYSIKTIETNSDYAEDLYKAFSIEKVKITNTFPIYFDVSFYNAKNVKDCNNFFEIIEEELKGKILIKPHPSKLNVWNGSNKEVLFTSDTFETFCLKYSFNNNVLISAFSTSCLIPKMIFGMEPYVILFYKLFKNYSSQWKNIDKIIEAIKKDYNNQEKFVIPNNEEEFRRSLSLVLNKEEDYYE